MDLDTRASLIARLEDPSDDLAWREFVAVYQPLLVAISRKRGLQVDDADEVAQETLIAVSKSIKRFKPDERSGSFRRWLATIARNKLVDYLSSPRMRQRGSGDSNVRQWLEQQTSETAGESTWDFQQKRQLFRWAAESVRSNVNAKTWQAFDLTAVQGMTVEKAAKELQIKPGMIYVARSRVMSRIRKAVSKWSDNDQFEWSDRVTESHERREGESA